MGIDHSNPYIHSTTPGGCCIKVCSTNDNGLTVHNVHQEQIITHSSNVNNNNNKWKSDDEGSESGGSASGEEEGGEGTGGGDEDIAGLMYLRMTLSAVIRRWLLLLPELIWCAIVP